MSNNTKFNFIVMILIHALFVTGLVMGFEATFATINEIIGIVTRNTSSALQVVSNLYQHLISLDKFFLVGAIFGAGLLFYDMKVLTSWFFGFTYVEERKCKSCQIKLVRKERERLDHWLSFIFPVRRFLCIGCGRQYLRADRGQRKEHKVPSKPSTVEVFSISKIKD